MIFFLSWSHVVPARALRIIMQGVAREMRLEMCWLEVKWVEREASGIKSDSRVVVGLSLI